MAFVHGGADTPHSGRMGPSSQRRVLTTQGTLPRTISDYPTLVHGVAGTWNVATSYATA